MPDGRPIRKPVGPPGLGNSPRVKLAATDARRLSMAEFCAKMTPAESAPGSGQQANPSKTG